MHTRVVRFTSRLALVSFIIFFTARAALITRYKERTVALTSTGSIECTIIPGLLNLPESLPGDYRHYSDAGLIQSNEKKAKSNYNNAFGAPTNFTSSLENPQSDVIDYELPNTMTADSTTEKVEDAGLTFYLEEEQETITGPDTEHPFKDNDSTATASEKNIEENSDDSTTNTPAQQVLTKVRTKIKCVETILKKAVIEPYHINGQIEGLQLTGLEKILVARDLLLKSGDIIRSVNGQPLNSKKRAYEIFKKARRRPMIRIDLLRDGESRTLLYCLK